LDYDSFGNILDTEDLSKYFIHYPIIVNLRYIITSIYILGLYSRPGGAEWLCMDLSCNISFIFYY